MDALSGLDFSGRRRLPAIQSAEAAECGLACLAMIARYHGHDVDLNGLRQAPAEALSAWENKKGFITFSKLQTPVLGDKK